MVPNGWSEKRLGSVLERVAVPVRPEPDSRYREIGIRSHGKGIFYKEAVLGKTLGNKRVFKVLPDCFVVNIVFAWEQAVAKTTEKEVGFIASHRFPMYKPIEGKCNVDFINYFFRTKRGKYLLELASPGGAGRNKTLGQKEFVNLRFPMPEGAEQTKIAQILSTWDKAIETTEKLIENSKAQKKALMQQLLTGKKRLPGFDGEWKFAIFGELFRIANDKSKQIKKTEYKEFGTFPIVDQGKELVVAYTDSTQLYTDIPVIVFGDHTRAIKWVDFPFVPGSDGTQLIKTTHNLNLRFGAFLLSHAKLPNLGYSRHMRELKEKEFKYPCRIDEQQRITSIIAAADKEIGILQQKLDYLKQEKKALMQQLLTGKRRGKLKSVERMHA